MSVSWTNDGSKRGGPSSMDLLMGWLSTPGNYKKWESQRKKLPVTEEIVKEMNEQGIKHRSPSCVYFKVHNLKRSYASTKQWLETNNQLNAFLSCDAPKKVEATVLKRCSLFRELTHIFEDDKNASTISAGEEGEAEEGSVEPSDEEKVDSSSVQGKRKCQDTIESRSKKSGKQTQSKASDSKSTSIAVNYEAELQGASPLFKNYPVGFSFPGNEDLGEDSVKSVALMGTVGEEMAQRLIEFEVKRKEELAKVHLDAEKKREEIRTKFETILSRHKLQREGCLEEEINAAFLL